MKKLLTIVLAMVMVFSMTAVSFADEVTHQDQGTVTITKTYEATNEGTTSPAETFSFTALTCTDVADAGVGVTVDTAPVPTIESVTYAAGDAGKETAATKDITITLPAYTAVGVYTYTFSEVAGDTAGVNYYGKPITLKVTVIEQNGKIRVAAVHTEGTGDKKSDEFSNVYSAGTLTVGKQVTGLFGDKQKDFTVKVTFTAPEGKTVKEAIKYNDDGEKTIEAGWTGSKEVEITLKDAETVTFTNIPYGVTYAVLENDYTTEAAGGYDAAKYDENQKGTIESATVSTEIENSKGGTVDTGIIMDNGIYILLLVGAAAGVGLFIARRRNSFES